MPPRRPASDTSTRSPTARSYPRTANPTSSSAWTSSDRPTSSPTLTGSGPNAADGIRTRTGSRAPCGRATYTRPHGVRHLFAAYDLTKDKLYGHIKPKRNRTRFLEFCRYLRSLLPPEMRIAIVLDNFSPHLTTKKDTRVGDWATGQQHRARLHTHQQLLAQRHRSPVHRPALLRPGRHRPCQPHGTGQHDPPLHHLEEQTRRPRMPMRGREQGEHRLSQPVSAFTAAVRHQPFWHHTLPGPDRPATASLRARRPALPPRCPTTR